MGFFTSLALFLQTVAQLGTHVLFATLGGILCEKVGNLNLGIEGIMLLGASVGFWTALTTASPLLTVLASAVAGMAGALIYAFVTVTLRGNQTVTGLALTTFGTGVSSMLGAQLAGKTLPAEVTTALGSRAIPVLSKIPFFGKIFFEQSPFVPLAVLTAVLLYFYYNKTTPGLSARMVGESPAAADASGIPVNLVKYLHILAGGALCGIGGGFFAVVYAGRWQNSITSGAGWIAVALVIFATWNPLRAILGAYLFGTVRGLGFKLQSGLQLFGMTLTFNPQLLDMLPYLVTILVLIVITVRKKRESQPPASLRAPYFREER